MQVLEGECCLNEIITFADYYHNKVMLSFTDHPFSRLPKHVWVVCRFHDQWLLTQHPRRGWEFPGGKVEEGESADEAAKREVFEETGADIDRLHYIGQYKVIGRSGLIIKNVYFATIIRITQKDDYMETNGPIFIQYLPKNIKTYEKYSFLMKDDVLTYCMKKINECYLVSPPVKKKKVDAN